MITSVCFLLLVASVPLFGGSLTKLGEVRLQKLWAIVAALVVQIVVVSVIPDRLDAAVAGALHVFSYLLALVFVWFNRHHVGMIVIVAGGLMNLAAIAANEGVMPARAEALETAGIVVDAEAFQNSTAVEDANLWFLGDVFAIPEGYPFANVFSIGDILLVLGGGILVHSVCDTRLAALFRRGSARRTEADVDDLVSISEALRLSDGSGASSDAATPTSPAATTQAPATPAVFPAPTTPAGGTADDERTTAPTPVGATAPLRTERADPLADLFAVDHLPQRR